MATYCPIFPSDQLINLTSTTFKKEPQMKPMTPIQIKHALEQAGYTQAKIAKECEVSKPFVNKVIKNTATSHRVRCYIAKVIALPVERVWTIGPDPAKPGPRTAPA
jgi:lambda repressor-like predicted transcriptional regulator